MRVDDFEYGRGFRERGQVMYDDHLTERQFVRVGQIKLSFMHHAACMLLLQCLLLVR